MKKLNVEAIEFWLNIDVIEGRPGSTGLDSIGVIINISKPYKQIENFQP